AGSATLVCLNSSAVPENMIDVLSNPNISFDFRNNPRATSLLSYNSLPIPGNWEPSLGKTYAFFNSSKILQFFNSSTLQLFNPSTLPSFTHSLITLVGAPIP